ncbi:MAG: Fic family protein [Polyangiales bacterium]
MFLQYAIPVGGYESDRSLAAELQSEQASVQAVNTDATSGLESGTERSIVAALEDEPKSRAQIAAALGHERISGAVNRAIRSLLDKDIITCTHPDKPRSRLQKYRLTVRGIRLCASARGR